MWQQQPGHDRDTSYGSFSRGGRFDFAAAGYSSSFGGDDDKQQRKDADGKIDEDASEKERVSWLRRNGWSNGFPTDDDQKEEAKTNECDERDEKMNSNDAAVQKDTPSKGSEDTASFKAAWKLRLNPALQHPFKSPLRSRRTAATITDSATPMDIDPPHAAAASASSTSLTASSTASAAPAATAASSSHSVSSLAAAASSRFAPLHSRASVPANFHHHPDRAIPSSMPSLVAKPLSVPKKVEPPAHLQIKPIRFVKAKHTALNSESTNPSAAAASSSGAVSSSHVNKAVPAAAAAASTFPLITRVSGLRGSKHLQAPVAETSADDAPKPNIFPMTGRWRCPDCISRLSPDAEPQDLDQAETCEEHQRDYDGPMPQKTAGEEYGPITVDRMPALIMLQDASPADSHLDNRSVPQREPSKDGLDDVDVSVAQKQYSKKASPAAAAASASSSAASSASAQTSLRPPRPAGPPLLGVKLASSFAAPSKPFDAPRCNKPVVSSSSHALAHIFKTTYCLAAPKKKQHREGYLHLFRSNLGRPTTGAPTRAVAAASSSSSAAAPITFSKSQLLTERGALVDEQLGSCVMKYDVAQTRAKRSRQQRGVDGDEGEPAGKKRRGAKAAEEDEEEDESSEDDNEPKLPLRQTVLLGKSLSSSPSLQSNTFSVGEFVVLGRFECELEEEVTLAEYEFARKLMSQ
jgi:hypothetical protein